MHVRIASLFFLTTLLLSTISSAMTINGKKIKELIKPGQVLTYNDQGADNVVVRIKNGNIEIGSYNIKDADRMKVREFYQMLCSNKDKLVQRISPDTVEIRALGDITVKGAYYSGDEEVVLESCSDLTITDAILRAKQVACIGKTIHFANGCFLETNRLQLESKVPSSLCKIIRFTLAKNSEFPSSVQGKLNFGTFCTDETTQELLVVGANKAEIVLAEQAFE